VDTGQLDQAMADEILDRLRALQEIAFRRGQSLAQLAIAWTLRDRDGGRIASAIIGASSVEQLRESLRAAGGPALSAEELREIDEICQ
jgi:L-glyceraldehyde 3-phosphate reductase